MRAVSGTAARTANVIGAGIGGLAAAIALRRAGWNVRVFERASSPRELGFALMLAPNALASLRELGVADSVLGRGVTPRHVEIRRPDGHVLRHIDLAGLIGPSGPRAVMALRQDLHGALVAALGLDAIELNAVATGVIHRPTAAIATFADGRHVAGDLLVGADGAGSVVRRTLHPQEGPPRHSPYVAVRGVAHDAARVLDGLDAVTYLGQGVEASLARASATSVYWYLSLLAADTRAERDPRVVLERHAAGFDAQFKSVAHASDDLRFDDLVDRAPMSSWGSGPITLLGDAAHPMLPHAGQGAAQALEDAVGLALALRGTSEIPAALRRYERVRARRTGGFVKLARRIARVSTTRSRMIGDLRDTAVRLMPERLIVGAFSRAGERDPNAALRE
jgi:2-polyprenyl-6-methoxyphenol hydroxylase-like FAD-dependent oxidoreductase